MSDKKQKSHKILMREKFDHLRTLLKELDVSDIDKYERLNKKEYHTTPELMLALLEEYYDGCKVVVSSTSDALVVETANDMGGVNRNIEDAIVELMTRKGALWLEKKLDELINGI